VVSATARVDALREVHVRHGRVVAVRADDDGSPFGLRGARGPQEVPGHRVAVERDREGLRASESHGTVERLREPVERVGQALVDGRAVEHVDADLVEGGRAEVVTPRM
jgi:hypothetical protein